MSTLIICDRCGVELMESDCFHGAEDVCPLDNNCPECRAERADDAALADAEARWGK